MSARLLLVLLVAAGTAAAQEDAPLPEHQDEAAAEGSLESAAATLRRARDGLTSAAEYPAALLPAQELVTTLRSESGAQLAADLLALARIQTALGATEDAEASFLEAIRLQARASGEFSLALLEPYHGLGRAYLAAGRYPEALVVLQQAQHISQRNLGLFNVEQAALIDDMTRAYLSAGNTVEAERLQVQRMENAVRRYGPGDERVVPYRLQLADYYERSRLHGRAREQYLEVVSAREEQHGADHPSLLAPLRELAEMDLVAGDRSDARDRLSAVMAANPEVDPLEGALSLALLGDWALVGKDLATARDYYRRAYTMLAAKDEQEAARLFSEPVALDFIPPLTSVDRAARSRRAHTYGVITLEFSLAEDGRPWDVRAVAADPPGVVDSAYVRRVRETHFRPQLSAGEPVATSKVQFTHYFRYYVDD